MHLKFCVLFLFLQSDHLSDYVLEELLITYEIFALVYDLEEHVF